MLFRSKLNGVSGIGLPVYLYDKELGISQNLLNNNVYEFNFSGGVEKNRFELRFSELSEVKQFESNQINIFPNPAGDFVVISGKSEIKNIELLDVTGKSVLKKQINSETGKIDLKKYQPGVYFLKIRTENSEFVKSLIIE